LFEARGRKKQDSLREVYKIKIMFSFKLDIISGQWKNYNVLITFPEE